MSEEVFVFGSNLAGIHGKGAALFARQHYGAVLHQAEGRQGQSYAIPTRDMVRRSAKRDFRTLSLGEINEGVCRFLDYARQHPEIQFFVTRLGCGLAGYSQEQIAPMFAGAPVNCQLPAGWRGHPQQEQTT